MPPTDPTYQSGFGNEFATEAVPGALPKGQNSPQHPPLGLYTEQLSGSAFTAPRSLNRRTWTYRIRPSVTHKISRKIAAGFIRGGPFNEVDTPPNQMRWDPLPLPSEPTDFVDGLNTIGGNGEPALQTGFSIHIYTANQSMTSRVFYTADGDLLIVPQLGALRLATELGILHVKPGEIAVIPRGIKFLVELADGPSRGYVYESFSGAFRLPDLGPIGANGLANPRDFLVPVAAFEDRDEPFRIVSKFLGNLWEAEIDHSPLDVVAWHGNYTPYKYDLALFNCINTVSFDHPDPSIYTVLTAPGCDFAIFPPRWLVAEHTFRPPWFHRNIMNEFMGLIFGQYDAKAEGFLPGGASLHNCMSGHGPDAETYERATSADLKPQYLADTLAFMFETQLVIRPTRFAMESPTLQPDYYKCWQGLRKHFAQ